MNKPDLYPDAFSQKISAMVRNLGSSEFSPEFLAKVNEIVATDHFSVLAFGDQLIPRFVIAESRKDHDIAREAGGIYDKFYFYRQDPNTRQVRERDDVPEGPILSRMLAKDIPDPDYRQKIYEKFDMIERLSLIDQSNGLWFTLNLYRDTESDIYSDDEIIVINQIAPLLTALMAKHLALTQSHIWDKATRPPVELLERLLREIGGKLSDREIDVCARALYGMTGEGIGLDIGVQPATVATLRKRAYAKLNISTLNELFALCLGQVAGRWV